MTLTTLIWLIFILTVHWFSDFVLQNNWEAKQKAVSFKALLSHTTTYCAIWFILLFVISIFGSISIADVGIYSFITYISHTAVDYFTSKVNRKLQIQGQRTDNYHSLFVSIGFDQLLHGIQLILCYYYILQ